LSSGINVFRLLVHGLLTPEVSPIFEELRVPFTLWGFGVITQFPVPTVTGQRLLVQPVAHPGRQLDRLYQHSRYDEWTCVSPPSFMVWTLLEALGLRLHCRDSQIGPGSGSPSATAGLSFSLQTTRHRLSCFRVIDRIGCASVLARGSGGLWDSRSGPARGAGSRQTRGSVCRT